MIYLKARPVWIQKQRQLILYINRSQQRKNTPEFRKKNKTFGYGFRKRFYFAFKTQLLNINDRLAKKTQVKFTDFFLSKILQKFFYKFC